MTERRNQFSKEDLVSCGQGTLFSIDSPRLPCDAMLMTDRVLVINTDGGNYGRGEAIAEMDINPDLWFFKCHFLTDPVMPGCLGIDALWQLTGFYLAWLGYTGKGRALGAGNIRFSGEVLPTSKTVQYHIHMRRIIHKNLVVGVADATVSVDGKEIYHAEKLRAGVVVKPNAEDAEDAEE